MIRAFRDVLCMDCVAIAAADDELVRLVIRVRQAVVNLFITTASIPLFGRNSLSLNAEKSIRIQLQIIE
jgi:hypothetical protein